ncbi:hypothetical protein JCM1840_001580 [Sporobolomyces johnsonii]
MPRPPATSVFRQALAAGQSTRFVSTAAAPVAQDASASTSSIPLPSSKQRAKDEAYQQMLDKVQQRRAQRFTADVFSTLGSTQNRDTTYQPHHNLHRPPSPVELTTSHLVAAGAHLGHSPASTHRASLPHVYGTRTGVSYIDLRQTLPALRRAAQVVKGVVERDGKVLFVGSLKGAERAVWENAARLGENGYGVTKWLPGTISNAKEVFGWSEIPRPQAAEGESDRWAPRAATPMSFKPDLLVLLSPTLNRHALREATGNEIPTIGIIDTDLDPRVVTYAIPANDDSPRAVELIAGVLGMAGKDGLKAKRERLEQQALIASRKRETEARLPLALLHAAQAKPMLVELKNGETFNGHLVGCDNFMNLTLKEVYQTSADGERFWKLAEAYVRGNNIKYIRVAENLIDQVKEQEDEQRRRGAGRGGMRGGGGGGGQGARGGGGGGRGRGADRGRGRGGPGRGGARGGRGGGGM